MLCLSTFMASTYPDSRGILINALFPSVRLQHQMLTVVRIAFCSDILISLWYFLLQAAVMFVWAMWQQAAMQSAWDVKTTKLH